jgi:probable HAF family extracellular repeat protein
MHSTIASRLTERRMLGFGLALIVLSCFNTAAAQAPYAVTDLGSLGGSFSIAFGVNTKSQVTGGANLVGDTASHAFRWQDGVMRDLGTLGGANSLAYNPNSRGEVTGVAETSKPDPLGEDFCGYGTQLICRAFFWHTGVMHGLGTLGGNNSLAIGINSSSQIAGCAETRAVDPNTELLITRAFLWEKGVMKKLGTLGGYNSNGHTLNEPGQLVGWSETTTTPDPTLGFPPFHAFLWEKDVMTDLGTLGGKMSIFPWINNRRQVVGQSSVFGDANFHAFLWQDGVMHDLGTLPGDTDSAAFAINDRGQTAGQSCDASGNCRAVLWHNGMPTDFNTLIPADSGLYLLGNFKINAVGEVVGLAFQNATGEIHAFLATPRNGEPDGESITSAGIGQIGETPKVVLPESVRKMLRERIRRPYPNRSR